MRSKLMSPPTPNYSKDLVKCSKNKDKPQNYDIAVSRKALTNLALKLMAKPYSSPIESYDYR